MTIYWPRLLQATDFTSCLFVSQSCPTWWHHRHFWCVERSLVSAYDRHSHFWPPNECWLPSYILIRMNYRYNSKSRKLLKYNTWGFCQSWKSLVGHEHGWAHRSVLNSFISVLLLIHLKRNTWDRETRSPSLFMFLQFIFLGIINFSSQRVECCLVSLCFFHYLSYLSFIFLAFSLIATVSQDIIKLEWGTSHPSVVAYRYFRPHTLGHVALLLWHVWKDEEVPDIPQLELMAQLWITFDI